jgi:ATP-dependent helicase/nuclease subunit A
MERMELSSQQRRAVERRGQDVCTVAGPGSGKTRVLVERFAWLVEQGTDPERILAITFTEKAVREVKSRLAKRFAQDEERRRQIERAPVSTIHAFCHGLLREHALEAGLDPGFEVLDERRAERELRSALARVLDRFALERAEEWEALMEAWDAEDAASELHAVFEAVRAAGGCAAARAHEPLIDAQGPLDELDQAARALLELIAGGNTEAQRRRETALRAWLAARASSDAFEWAMSFGIDKRLKDQQVKDAIERCRGLAEEAARAELWRRHARERATLWAMLEQIEREYRTRLRALPALDFAGLEEEALRLLESDGGARRSARERFDAILMDELQDTNPIQWKIVNLVRREGRFFAVGDVNQSIFGFRHADPSQFRGYQREVEERGWEIDRLEQNYRSRPEILRMAEALAPHCEGLAAHRLLAGYETYPEKTARSVEVQRCEKGEDGEDWEAFWIAQRMLELKCELNRNWSDFAVLVRTKAPIDELEIAFVQAGIPYRVTRGKNFFEEQEIVDLTNWLRVLDQPANEVAMFALLRSPLFGLADERLFAARTKGEWPPAEARDRLERLRAALGVVPVRQLLARELDETGSRARLDERGRANIGKFLDLLAGFEQEHPADTRPWLEEIDELAASGQEAGAVVVEGGDAVEVLTIHKAKGLEWPVVIVASIGRGSARTNQALLWHAEAGLGARWRTGQATEAKTDPAYERAKQRRQSAEDLESHRLLYVAMTRAEQHLVLSWRQGGHGAWPALVERALGVTWPEQTGTVQDQELARVVRRQGVPVLEGWRGSEAGAEAEELDVLEEGHEAPPVVTVTALSHFEACPMHYWLSHELRWPVEGASGGVALGIEVHELLAGEAEETEASEEAVALKQRFEQSELGRRAARAAKVERECGFLVDLDGTLLRGTIDLWFREGGELVVVDYKTGRSPSPERLGEYERQVQLYGLALERMLGRMPTRGVLYFLHRDEPHEVEMGDKARVEALRLVEVFRGAGERGEYPLREGVQCERCPHWKRTCGSRWAGVGRGFRLLRKACCCGGGSVSR